MAQRGQGANQHVLYSVQGELHPQEGFWSHPIEMSMVCEIEILALDEQRVGGGGGRSPLASSCLL